MRSLLIVQRVLNCTFRCEAAVAMVILLCSVCYCCAVVQFSVLRCAIPVVRLNCEVNSVKKTQL